MIAPPAVPARVAAAVAGAQRPVCMYVYDTTVLHARAEALRAALPEGAELLYAVKANGHPAVVAALARCVDGLEVASGGELALAVDSGARRIAFGGPAKTDAELQAAVAAGVLVHVESVHELRRLALMAAGANVTVALRVNRAGTSVHGSHLMTGVASPFGIDEAQLGDAMELAARLPEIDLVGFHLHAVSNNLDAAAHAAFVAGALDWAVTTSARDGIDLRYVNVGGGFGVDYTGSGAFDLPAFARALAEAVDGRPAGVRLVFEPGRFLAADAGWYAAEVLDLKRVHGTSFAVLRGGTHHFRLPAAWGYSHPFTVVPVPRWPYGGERPEVRDAAVTVAGELCTPRDVLARDVPVDRLRVGDVLVFGNAGAYGWDISHHDFLRHPRPEVVTLAG